jgi:TolA-binding protein
LAESPTDVAPPPSPPPPQPSAIAEESALLGAAMQRLRERDDAAGALALLDEHDRRFGATGVLTDEATTTRVEALLRAGAFSRALTLLDGLAPRLTGRGRELRATRGELRADAGRCAEAVADFEALLSGGTPPDVIGERALYGRAACHARLGEHDAARADLEAYLAQFPAGRYAGRARAALEP